jgi:hypothetical protein
MQSNIPSLLIATTRDSGTLLVLTNEEAPIENAMSTATKWSCSNFQSIQCNCSTLVYYSSTPLSIGLRPRRAMNSKPSYLQTPTASSRRDGSNHAYQAPNPFELLELCRRAFW